MGTAVRRRPSGDARAARAAQASARSGELSARAHGGLGAVGRAPCIRGAWWHLAHREAVLAQGLVRQHGRELQRVAGGMLAGPHPVVVVEVCRSGALSVCGRTRNFNIAGFGVHSQAKDSPTPPEISGYVSGLVATSMISESAKVDSTRGKALFDLSKSSLPCL